MILLQLPSEVLSLIISNIPTKGLLTILPTCREINHISRDVIRSRIRRAANLDDDDTMYFEAFHPTERNLRPALKCLYHSTPDFGSTESCENHALSDIHGLYSEYQLTTFPTDRNPFASTESNLARRLGRQSSSPLTTIITFDEDERFTQLVARSGLLFSFSKYIFMGLELQLDVVRVFKEWLREHNNQKAAPILWLHEQKHVGIKLAIVKEPESGPDAVFERYHLTYEGEFLSTDIPEP
jgi:hypothetical protein